MRHDVSCHVSISNDPCLMIIYDSGHGKKKKKIISEVGLPFNYRKCQSIQEEPATGEELLCEISKCCSNFG